MNVSVCTPVYAANNFSNCTFQIIANQSSLRQLRIFRSQTSTFRNYVFVPSLTIA